jgi:D-glycero-alpha-D-manno-heptose-7-phosphate kinase
MSVKFNFLDKINLIAKRSLQIFESRSNLDLFGELLDETWNIKKKLSNNVTNSIIDKIYNLAKNSGAIGGKLLGAGAGGFILFYVPQKSKKRVIHALSKYKIIDFNFTSKGTEIINI